MDVETRPSTTPKQGKSRPLFGNQLRFARRVIREAMDRRRASAQTEHEDVTDKR